MVVQVGRKSFVTGTAPPRRRVGKFSSVLVAAVEVGSSVSFLTRKSSLRACFAKENPQFYKIVQGAADADPPWSMRSQ
jgi:hypothetical protein